MKPKSYVLWFLFAAGTGFTGLACNGDDLGEGNGTDTGDPADGEPGEIHANGIWDGDQPDGVNFDVAVFECPFTMPPDKASLDNAVDPDTGAVSGLVEDVSPGKWCVMAYIDMVPDDGLAPIQGIDATNTTGKENANGAIPITVTANQTTELELTFAIQAP